MTVLSTALIVVSAIIIIFTITFAGYVLMLAYDRFIVSRRNPIYDESFEQLLVILSLIINSEIEEYENEILMGDRPITNKNFEAFYNDITKKILDNLSQDLIAALCRYTTEENVVRIIARRTKTYLRGKVNAAV